MKHSFKYKNQIIEYNLSRTAKKRINLRIKPDGEVCVSAPKWVTIVRIEEFLRQKGDWILSHQQEYAAQVSARRIYRSGSIITITDVQYRLQISCNSTLNRITECGNVLKIALVEKPGNEVLPAGQDTIRLLLERFAKKKLLQYITYRQPQIQACLIGIPKPSHIHVHNANTRWGSCSSKGGLNFSLHLALAPKECIDCIIVHETCHLAELNHSPAFWSLVEQVMPTYRDWEGYLNQNGHKYHF